MNTIEMTDTLHIDTRLKRPSISPESSLYPFFAHNFQRDETQSLQLFVQMVYDYRKNYGRLFPWQETKNPYKILLSEVMLQQTQTERVLPKYTLFLSKWPTLHAFAQATPAEVLPEWKGLGYNRRCINLLKAMKLCDNEEGIKNDQAFLLSLPSVGKSTAAAVQSFAYGEKSIYLETNIRRVLIEFFYPVQVQTGINDEHLQLKGSVQSYTVPEVHDKELTVLLQKLLVFVPDSKQWYYALMDVGAQMKKELPNANKRSKHYHTQSKFEGSERQLRGQILQCLIEQTQLSTEDFLPLLPSSWTRAQIEKALITLHKDALVTYNKEKQHILPLQ